MRQEQEIPDTMTIVAPSGKTGCKYTISFQFGLKSRRKRMEDKWPQSEEENLERLKDAGFVMDNLITKCRNCGGKCDFRAISTMLTYVELGHSSKACKEEKQVVAKEAHTCAICRQEGHFARDCTEIRVDPHACRNCKKPGHKKEDCPEPPDASNVECRKCNQMGHFSRDCPNVESQPRGCRNCGEEGHMAKECEKPKNPDNVTCRNCEKSGLAVRAACVVLANKDIVGHFSRDCPEPKDWSKVKCSNCGEMGHTIKRCKQPVPDENGDGGFGGGDDGAAAGGWVGDDAADTNGAGTGGWTDDAGTGGGVTVQDDGW